MLAELLATEGVTEHVELGSTFGFMAFHGGSLEAMTDTVAREAAEQAGASLYAIRQPRGFRWHIPSKLIDPSRSEAMTTFLAHVDVVVAVHGWGTDGWAGNPFGQGLPGDRRPPRPDRPLLLGGRNRELARHLGTHVRAALPQYVVVDELDDIPPRMRGIHPDNPVNAPAGHGVQLELPPKVRGLPPFWTGEDRGMGCPDTQALVAALAQGAASFRR